MNDISSIDTDIRIYDANVSKAENVLSVQLGNLYYAPDFGIDLRYFLSEDFEFTNESFRSYCLQRLTEHYIDVVSVSETVSNLFTFLGINIAAKEDNSGLVR
jgi:hypothetical protein